MPSARGSNSQKFEQIFAAELAVAKDSAEESGADRLSGVHRHYRRAPIDMTNKVMAAPHPYDLKTAPSQCCDQVLSGHGRK